MSSKITSSYKTSDRDMIIFNEIIRLPNFSFGHLIPSHIIRSPFD